MKTVLFILGLLIGAFMAGAALPPCHCPADASPYLSREQWELAKSLGASEVADKTRVECNALLARRAKGVPW